MQLRQVKPRCQLVFVLVPDEPGSYLRVIKNGKLVGPCRVVLLQARRFVEVIITAKRMLLQQAVHRLTASAAERLVACHDRLVTAVGPAMAAGNGI